MNPLLITLAVAVPLLLVLALLVFRQSMQVSSLEDVEKQWQRVDMEAFLNLADPAEENYLRRNLSGSEFRSIQRLRVRAMWEYLGRLAHNSKLMMRAGQMVQHQSSGVRLQEATQLVAAASRMRILVLGADVYLAVRFLLPQTQDPIRSLVGKYDSLTQAFAHTCANNVVSISAAS